MTTKSKTSQWISQNRTRSWGKGAMNKIFPRIYLPMEGSPVVNWEQRYLALEQRFHVLEQRCTELLAENQALREQLNTTSNNSSKPPSQDPNRKSRRSESTGRKPGGQPGHAGHKKNTLSARERQ